MAAERVRIFHVITRMILGGAQEDALLTLEGLRAGGAYEVGLVTGPETGSEGELLSRVDRGIWVTRFHYVNAFLNPRRATMTGLTRDGTFLIEEGKLTRGIRNLRFMERILEAFSRIDGLTEEVKAVGGRFWEPSAYVAPTILIRDFRFTGSQTE